MDEKLLLEILQRDARIPAAKLAKMLNAPEGDVEKKIKELRKSGVIRGFRAYIDWEKAGEDYITAYIEVKVTPEARTGFSELGQQIASNEKVEDVFVHSGDSDIMIKVRARDIGDVSKFVTEYLAPKKEVVGTATHFVLKKFKENGIVLGDGAKPGKLVLSA